LNDENANEAAGTAADGRAADSDAALDIARRIADGEAVDLSALQAENPALAQRLAKLQALVKAMQAGGDAGTSWGHLQQLQLAGQGGFGAVYRAYDPTLDRTVALKLRHRESDALLPSGRDFVAEARRLARVRHPNVLAVHGASYHDGRAGLWADWIDGETLTARLQRSGALQGDELLRVLAELADALEAVHRAGLVHGDIKASNVMLDARGRVILMDFGAGFDSSDEGSAVSAGTPRYLAPEIIAGNTGTQAVDLYAYGVLAHLLATNRYPEPAQPSPALRPRGLRSLVAQLLDADPRARPSADRLRHALQRLIDAPRRRVRRALLASVVIGSIGIALATAIGLQREQAQRQVAERVSEFLASLYREHDPLRRDAASARPPELQIADAITRVETELSDDPHSQARLLRVMGEAQLHLSQIDAARVTLDSAMRKLGEGDDNLSLRAEIDGLRSAVASRELRTDDAKRHFDSALALATRASGPESVDAGRIHALSSFSMLSLTRYPDAKVAAENAHRILVGALGAEHPESIQALVALSLAQEVLREDAAAMVNVREAIAMLEQRYGSDDARLIRPLHILGSLLNRQRQFEESRAALIRGADIARQRIGPRSGSLANMLTLRGDMERAAGDPAVALAVLGEAEQAMPDDEILGRAQLHSIRGSVHFERGDGKLAERDFREALRLRASSKDPRTASSWFVQGQIGDALALQGRFDEAHLLQQEAAENMRALLGADAYQNTLIVTRRAGTYAMQGDWKNSAIQTREALRILDKTYGREHPNHFLWNLDLAWALSRSPEGRDEAARIADALIAAWSDDVRVARSQARLLLLRCELHLAAGAKDAARTLVAATLARSELAVSDEQRTALEQCAAGNYAPLKSTPTKV
jgi:serine/threonine protein kinase